MKIDADTDRQKLASTIAGSVDREAVRQSDARTSRLQRNIRRQARQWDAEVRVTDAVPTADVSADPENFRVRITTEPPEQHVTDIDGKSWDWLAQRAYGVHEVGHIRYTDFETKDDRLDDIDRGERGTAHSLWNAAEDAAIEQQVVGRWGNYYEPLRLLRANLFHGTDAGIKDPEMGGSVFPVAHAAETALLDMLAREVYDLNIGDLDLLLDDTDDTYHFATLNDEKLFRDEVLPLCEDLIEASLTTPRAKDRQHLQFNIVEKILDLLDDADADGKSQKNGESGEEGGPGGMPDDSRENHSGGADVPAEELSPEEIDSVEVTEETDSDGEETASVDADDLDDLDDVQADPDAVEDAREQASDDAREEAGVTEDLLDELEEMSDSIGAGDGLEADSIEFPTHDWAPDEETVRKAERQSGRLAQILRQRLQSERRTKTRRDQPRGRLDSTRHHRTEIERMPKRVKQNRSEPDEKDYRCALVLDRSGSMTGQMSAAEEAAGMLLLALEEVGVETMLIEMFDSRARLAKPFQTSTAAQKGRVFHGRTSGGTPLGKVVDLTRERMHRESGNRFMFVLTDDGLTGRSREVFENGVRECNFPVLGVNLISSGEDSKSQGVFHREVSAQPSQDLQQELTNLLNEVMF